MPHFLEHKDTHGISTDLHRHLCLAQGVHFAASPDFLGAHTWAPGRGKDGSGHSGRTGKQVTENFFWRHGKLAKPQDFRTLAQLHCLTLFYLLYFTKIKDNKVVISRQQHQTTKLLVQALLSIIPCAITMALHPQGWPCMGPD